MIIGGLVYYIIELLWRGYSDLSMFFVGGICFVLVGLINEVMDEEMPLAVQALLGGTIITAVELVSGLILNVQMGLGIWDYSSLPFNFMGQICLEYSLLWVLLSVVAVLLDDWLRHKLFGEHMPSYRII